MNSKITIRIATIDDVQLLALLGRTTYIQSHEIYFEDKSDMIAYCNHEYSVENLKKGIKDLNTVFWIASFNEIPVGFAEVKLNAKTQLLNSNKQCKLQKIYVLAEYTSMKIGRELHSKIIGEAKSQSMEELWLTAYYKNSRAINFYSKNGFRQIGEGNFIVEGIDYKQTVLSMKL